MEKQKKIPQLRFPEFEGEWEKNILNDTCTIIGGGTPNSGKEEFWNGHIQWFTPTEIKMDYVSKSERTITELGLKKSSANFLPKGTILLTSRATIGEVAIALNECTTNQGFQSLIVNKLYNNLFIFNWIKNNRYEFVRRANGSTFLEISKSEIGKIPIYIPTLPEQQKIASFFTAIDQNISQLTRKKTLLEQYKKGVMQKIFSQEIRFKDDNGQEFPKWEKMTGDALFKTVSNKNHNSDLPILAITQEHGAVPRDMIDYYITVSEQSIEGYKVVEKGDFIISLRSFQGGIEYSEYKGICSPAYIILRATQKIDHRYFKYYFKTEDYITNLNRKLEGIRDGKMISFKYFSEIKINVPSLPEQTKIANFLSAIDDKISQTQKQIEKAEVWKKGLMQQMFV
jgi:type I restriction enzyme S subunit